MRSMRGRVTAGMMLLLCCVVAGAEQRHAATGVVLEVDAAHRTMTVSCDAIAGYMDAMEMPFSVHSGKALAGLKPGDGIRFMIEKHGGTLYAEDIVAGTTVSNQSEPMQAEQLTELKTMLRSTAKVIAVGEKVPDFALTDQAGKTVHLAEMQGKVVALTFGYSRCPNPNYCFRLSNNLSKVEKRFHAQAGKDLVLITIMIDPEHDKGATLAEYAGVWRADPERWHFLTGPLPEIQQIAGGFGENFWRVDGTLTHSLHTVVIDRDGRLAANLEGNQFTPQALGDLIGSVMARQ